MTLSGVNKMTREEAIKIINCYDIGFYDLSGEKISADKLADAFDMAIEALSEPNMIPIKLEKRYPELRDENITDAFMQGYLKGKADRPQGEWIDKGQYAVCSNCGADSGTQFDGVQPVPRKTSFCPNCGAKMCKGGDDE